MKNNVTIHVCMQLPDVFSSTVYVSFPFLTGFGVLNSSTLVPNFDFGVRFGSGLSKLFASNSLCVNDLKYGIGSLSCTRSSDLSFD